MTHPYKPVNEIIEFETAGSLQAGPNPYQTWGKEKQVGVKMVQIPEEASQFDLFYLSAWQY